MIITIDTPDRGEILFGELTPEEQDRAITNMATVVKKMFESAFLNTLTGNTGNSEIQKAE